MRQAKFAGNPLTLEGKEVKVGESFRDFTVTNNDLSELKYSDTKGVRIFLAVPSIDTEVCDMEVRKFNKEASELENVTVYTVSMDLPFAQGRWCGAAGIGNVKVVSDYKSRSFGEATGTFIKELALLTRASFVVDSEGKVVFVEYLEEMTNEPTYKNILEAAKVAK
ncbi:thiol peroxidase [Clostridium sp.]|uniref:thiol peroxidase n=1 Tax=Clostridium sp. TaxID=1506 RepID=UPI003994E05D